MDRGAVRRSRGARHSLRRSQAGRPGSLASRLRLQRVRRSNRAANRGFCTLSAARKGTRAFSLACPLVTAEVALFVYKRLGLVVGRALECQRRGSIQRRYSVTGAEGHAGAGRRAGAPRIPLPIIFAAGVSVLQLTRSPGQQALRMTA
jgi:hypothetical protein